MGQRCTREKEGDRKLASGAVVAIFDDICMTRSALKTYLLSFITRPGRYHELVGLILIADFEGDNAGLLDLVPGIVLYGMTWHGMAWHGMAWHGMVRHTQIKATPGGRASEHERSRAGSER